MAVSEGDYVYAILKNSSINYNGQGALSLASPNRRSHKDLIKKCYDTARFNLSSLGYIEAQGMGLPLADMVEWSAINDALIDIPTISSKNATVSASTLKPLAGHMDCVSALGALFKILLSFCC